MPGLRCFPCPQESWVASAGQQGKGNPGSPHPIIPCTCWTHWRRCLGSSSRQGQLWWCRLLVIFHLSSMDWVQGDPYKSVESQLLLLLGVTSYATQHEECLQLCQAVWYMETLKQSFCLPSYLLRVLNDWRLHMLMMWQYTSQPAQLTCCSSISLPRIETH